MAANPTEERERVRWKTSDVGWADEVDSGMKMVGDMMELLQGNVEAAGVHSHALLSKASAS
jgi:hypothetical protein